MHEDEDGKALYDVPGAPIADEDAPAPVRLLGNYDNVWLSHAGRDRVTAPERRTSWMGVNGAQSNALFVDGWLEGLWRVEEGRVVLGEILRPLTRAERAELDEEVEHPGVRRVELEQRPGDGQPGLRAKHRRARCGRRPW